MSLCLSEILERVYAGQDGALEASHTDAEPAMQRSELLQPLCFFAGHGGSATQRSRAGRV